MKNRSDILRACILLLSIALPVASSPGASNVDPATALARMQALGKAGKWAPLLAEFKDVDLASWPDAARAFSLRGSAYARTKQGELAIEDLRSAVKASPQNGYLWHTLASAYRDFTEDTQSALDAYIKAYELVAAAHTSTPRGWMPVSATLEAVAILRDRGHYGEALRLLSRFTPEDAESMGKYWQMRMLRAYGQIYAGQGRETESLEKFRVANRVERNGNQGRRPHGTRKPG